MQFKTSRKRKLTIEDCNAMYALYKSQDVVSNEDGKGDSWDTIFDFVQALRIMYLQISGADFNQIYNSFEFDSPEEFYKLVKEEFPDEVV